MFSINAFFAVNSPRPRKGFTLIEMLVVITILGILIALIGGSVSMAIQKMNIMKSINQLRQVGVGIQLYANDNDATLPGPLFTGVQPRIRQSDTGQLATRIAPYLGYDVSNTWQTMKEMILESWKPHIPKYDPAAGGLSTLIVNWNDYDRSVMPSRPFGYPGNHAWSSQPIRTTLVTEPDRLWLVREQSLPSSDGTPFYPTGGKRLHLFLSGRVSLEEPSYSSYTQ